MSFRFQANARPALALALSALLFPPLLTGCAGSAPPIVKTVAIREPLPAALLDCEPDPDVPDATMGDREVAIYILALWQAGEDCRQRLAALKTREREKLRQ